MDTEQLKFYLHGIAVAKQCS